jgi:hypothetical protein
LIDATRPDDVVSRFGGDDFLGRHSRRDGAAANPSVPATVGTSLGAISGVAPAAMFATYKAAGRDLDGTTVGDGCATGNLLEAIGDAVADVTNYSIDSAQSSTGSPTDQAFLSAAAASIFVTPASGNYPAERVQRYQRAHPSNLPASVKGGDQPGVRADSDRDGLPWPTVAIRPYGPVNSPSAIEDLRARLRATRWRARRGCRIVEIAVFGLWAELMRARHRAVRRGRRGHRQRRSRYLSLDHPHRVVFGSSDQARTSDRRPRAELEPLLPAGTGRDRRRR